MHRPLNLLTGSGRATLALAAGCMAFTAVASEPVEITAPTDKTTSSLTPLGAKQEWNNEFKTTVFGRSESRGSASVDMPQSFGPRTGPVIDSKTRTKLLQEWDKKKNWLLNGRSTPELGQDKEADPFEELSGKHQTLLEKHILGVDAEGKETKDKESRRQKKNDADEDPSASSDQTAEERSLSGAPSQNGSDKDKGKDNSRAYFSDPFNRATPDKKDKDSSLFGNKDKKDDAEETAAAAQARSAARMGQIFALPSSGPGSSAPSALSGVAGPLSQRSTHLDDLHSILGRDPGAASSVAGILGGFASSRPFVAAPAPASTFALPAPVAPFVPQRRSEPIMKPQPSVLERPVRDF